MPPFVDDLDQGQILSQARKGGGGPSPRTSATVQDMKPTATFRRLPPPTTFLRLDDAFPRTHSHLVLANALGSPFKLFLSCSLEKMVQVQMPKRGQLRPPTDLGPSRERSINKHVVCVPTAGALHTWMKIRMCGTGSVFLQELDHS